METNPSLIEPGARYFMGQTLKECRKFKDKHHSLMFNIGLTVGLLLLVTGFLYMNYKGRPTKADLEAKKRREEHYILSKLQQHARTTHKKNDNMITDLPTWGDHPELAVLRNT